MFCYTVRLNVVWYVIILRHIQASMFQGMFKISFFLMMIFPMFLYDNLKYNHTSTEIRTISDQ